MKRILVAIGILLFPVPAMATNYTCAGQVQYLGVGGHGALYINTGNGVWAICNLTSSGYISKEACAGWYSGCLTARASARMVTLYFDPTANSGKTTCAALGDWSTPVPYFVQLD